MSVVTEPLPDVQSPAVTETIRSPHAQTIPLRVPPAAPRAERLPLLDLLRVVAAHLIVWHHLAFYGPLSDVAYQLFPNAIWALSEWGRYAVQVFFVVGGFVTARSLSNRGWIDGRAAADIVAKRYRRIGGPYLVALIIAILANPLADLWMDHFSISPAPTLPQVLAHVVFLQDVLGYDGLSAGLWYLAIDFQLGLLLLGLVMLSQRLVRDWHVGTRATSLSFALVAPLAVTSLFWFNRDARWEEWGLYFLGSYTLGVIVEGVLSRRLPSLAFWVYAGLMLVALVVEWRSRLAVGLATGVVIYLGGVTGGLSSWPKSRWIEAAAQSSYSLFLIHFPVCLLVNAFLSQYVLHSPLLCLAGMVLAYGLSVAASVVFYRHVERAFR
ncbi:MAG TPA: acyltransferase [Planctomycetaceae bacterium]|nr:acyltransferase [Planctomycetaceae bacterium]